MTENRVSMFPVLADITFIRYSDPGYDNIVCHCGLCDVDYSIKNMVVASIRVPPVQKSLGPYYVCWECLDAFDCL